MGYVEKVKQKLVYAGKADQAAVDRFLGIRVVTIGVAVLVFVLLFMFNILGLSGTLRLAVPGLFILALVLGPDSMLNRQVEERQHEIQITLPDTPGITLAEFADVYAGGAIATGWTAPTRYLGSNVTPPAGSPAQVGGVHKGAWPQSFVNFHGQTGTAAYWYSSGAAADPLKAQEPVGVHYSLNP